MPIMDAGDSDYLTSHHTATKTPRKRVALVGHAKGVGISDAELRKIQKYCENIPWVEVRKSTGGKGIHLYVMLDAIPTKNHTEHAAIARCILEKMSTEAGYNFANSIDCCGSMLWIWHRKLAKSDNGLASIYPLLFRAYAKESNWAYGDRYLELDFIQQVFLFSMYLLKRHGDHDQSPSFYEDAFLKAFPKLVDEVAGKVKPSPFSTPEKEIRNCYTWRTLHRFAKFLGLASVESIEPKKRFITQVCTLR